MPLRLQNGRIMCTWPWDGWLVSTLAMLLLDMGGYSSLSMFCEHLVQAVFKMIHMALLWSVRTIFLSSLLSALSVCQSMKHHLIQCLFTKQSTMCLIVELGIRILSPKTSWKQLLTVTFRFEISFNHQHTHFRWKWHTMSLHVVYTHTSLFLLHYSMWNFCGIAYTVRVAFHAILNSLPVLIFPTQWFVYRSYLTFDIPCM